MDPHAQCRSDIDLLPAEECIGRRARLVLDPDTIGHITSVRVNLGNRSYRLEWPLDGSIHELDFYGFQLDLIEE